MITWWPVMRLITRQGMDSEYSAMWVRIAAMSVSASYFGVYICLPRNR